MIKTHRNGSRPRHDAMTNALGRPAGHRGRLAATILGAGLVLIAAFSGAASSPTEAIFSPGMPASAIVPPYSARYEARAYGSTLEAVTELHYTDDTARFAMTADVSGLLRLVGRFRFERETRVGFDPQDPTLRPKLLETRDLRETPNRTRTSRARIQLDQGVAIGQAGDRSFSVSVPVGVQDFLSSLLFVMQQVALGTVSGDDIPVALLERDEIREYRLSDQGSETLDSALGTIETRRLTRFDDQGDAVFTAWLSEEHRGVPVRFDFDTGDRVFRLDIQSLDWHVTPALPLN